MSLDCRKKSMIANSTFLCHKLDICIQIYDGLITIRRYFCFVLYRLRSITIRINLMSILVIIIMNVLIINIIILIYYVKSKLLIILCIIEVYFARKKCYNLLRNRS